jgi:diguanylate cyclase (GGDEF)-like protein
VRRHVIFLLRQCFNVAMDPNSVIILLAAHLICSGVLYYVIGRRLAKGSGLFYWSAGALVFGSAYAMRFALDTQFVAVYAMLVDVCMVLAAAFFWAGMVRWLATRRVLLRWPFMFAVGYALVQVTVFSVWGAPARFMLLNLTLGTLYACIAVTVLLALKSQPQSLKLPLWVVIVNTGCLALLTAARGVYIGIVGVQPLFAGLMTQLYFAFASFSTLLMGMNLLWLVFERLNGRLLDMASHDALTGTLNRKGLDDVLARHFGGRVAAPLIFLCVDIDHFKRVNDQHGHAMGDAVLKSVAHALQARVRGNDFVARMGGEEFLVGFVGDDMQAALALGERLRAGVAQLQVPNFRGGDALTCTVSIGVSQVFNALDERDRAARESDAALYAAKAAGRNQVKSA